MDKLTLRLAIARLQEIKANCMERGEQRIMETGKGDFLLDGYVLGAALCIRALEDMLEKENAVL